VTRRPCGREGIRQLITERYPEHGISGEEHGNVGLTGLRWLDRTRSTGTRAFISGLPVWGRLSVLYHKGRASWGMMDQSVPNETYSLPARNLGGRKLCSGCQSDFEAAMRETLTLWGLSGPTDSTNMSRLCRVCCIYAPTNRSAVYSSTLSSAFRRSCDVYHMRGAALSLCGLRLSMRSRTQTKPR